MYFTVLVYFNKEEDGAGLKGTCMAHIDYKKRIGTEAQCIFKTLIDA